MTIELKGRISSDNAAQVEKDIMSQVSASPGESVVFEAAELSYISSAGLRVLLRVRKMVPDVRIIDVSSEIYDIFETTGYTKMMTVEMACGSVSVDGCEQIGGTKDSVYRLDGDKVVKVYDDDSLDSIRRKREVAKLARFLGIPTAVSSGMVKVGKKFGSVFEMINARSFAAILRDEPDKLDWCVREYVKLMRKIHSTLVPRGKLPDMQETALDWAGFLQDYLPEDAGKKLLALIEAVPSDDHMIHGDFQTRNLLVQNGEVVLVDTDSMAVGNPIFELGSIFNAFIGFYEMVPEQIKSFQGFDYDMAISFWKKMLAAYLGTNCPHKIQEVEDKARIIGYTRLIRRSIRRKGLETEKGRKEIEHWKQELLELLEKTDTLVFRFDELELEALTENLDEVQAFVCERLEAVDCSPKVQMQIDVSVEEIFVNIANYAYAPGTGMARIRAQTAKDPAELTLVFMDWGTPYDPLAREDPDITLSAEDRKIGGLGIYMTKTFMDDESYEYRDGQNILTLKKLL